MAVAGQVIEAQCRARCWARSEASAGQARPRFLRSMERLERGATRDMACKRDRDCVVAWDPCGYRVFPCRDTWKRAVNRAADARKRARWAQKKPACRPLTCASRGRWLGTRAVCVKRCCRIDRSAAAPKKAKSGSPCTVGAECQSGICEGPGCEPGQGRCAPAKRRCSKRPRGVCGCDSRTHVVPRDCPGIRYRRALPCDVDH